MPPLLSYGDRLKVSFSTPSILSNSGFTSGGYESFYIREVDGPFGIFDHSGPGTTPGVGMNIAGANQGTATNYVAFSVTPDSGYQTTFESLSFYTGTNFAGETYDIELRAWDGVAETSLGTTGHTSVGGNDTVVSKSIDFGDFTSDSAIEFRLYAWNTTDPNGGIRYDDIILNGNTTVIPEPSATLLFGFAGLGLLLRRRREST